MKEIKGISCIHVISEPGDMTRYDYIIYRDGQDNFCIMPATSTFRFPQRINYWDAQSILESADRLHAMADKFDCNRFTLKEVCRTIVELWED
jgi:hypothetical protein